MDINISGEGISPETISAKELGELLVTLEETLFEVIKKDSPDTDLDEVTIGLVEIQEGSVKLKFKASVIQVTTAFALVSNSIAQNDFSNLPRKSIESCKVISNFAKKKKCIVEFNPTDLNSRSSQITEDTKIEVPDSFFLTGNTVVYGKVERVGGAKPRARLRTTDDSIIYCDISEDIAKQLGYKLYQWVGLEGKAKWLLEDYSIESFEVHKLTDFESTSISDALSKLSDTLGVYWDQIEDIDSYLSEIRGVD